VKRIFFFGVLLIACIACDEKKNTFEDPQIRHIADLQDRRKTDSLLIYLQSDHVEYRKRAALALASVQDTTTINALSNIPDVEAVFALGQMYASGAYAPLKEDIGKGNTLVIRREAFEALGKVIRKGDLGVLRDSTNAEGVAWGIYRAGLRGVTDSTLLNKAASILSDKNSLRDDRLAAAHFFSRAQFKEQPDVAVALADAATDADVEIRMAAVNALSKLNDIAAVMKAVDDTDYRVRVNAARALRTKPWSVVKHVFEKLLNDPNTNVSIATAEVILGLAPPDWQSVAAWAKAAKNWRTQATLYEAVLKVNKSNDNSRDISKEMWMPAQTSKNQYQRAALITALSQASPNRNFIFHQYRVDSARVVKSAAAAGLARTVHDMRDPARELPEYVDIYKQIIADGDQGAIIYACNALGDTTLGFKKIITDYSFLEQAKSKLSLPRDYETYAPLEETLNYFKGLPPPAALKNEYNHPIDWALALTIAKDQKVLVKTSKGDVVMQLFIEEAPGSVVNFVRLVNSGYYNDKYFHRVVPNFVIQTGCNRGDGFGSEDYSIRSEFSQRKYKTGSVGMASAGKDTEGTQWFITHSPTPHLDGKYTIFAEVVSGMDVVHKIEVGDKIIEARLIKDGE
jgi:cyclophilin family peptidyl-prolyl cis-trans isomerase/HEAT repeat protein